MMYQISLKISVFVFFPHVLKGDAISETNEVTEIILPG